MMRGSSYLPLFLLFSFSCAFIIVAKSLPSSISQPQCHEDERSALLQFRNSFSTYCESQWNSSSGMSYIEITHRVSPKGVGWKNDTNHSNCCTWDGVKCDEETGHVVGLDLSCLNGTLFATNNLFRLVHLRSLSLTLNNFQGSKIPSEISHFHDLRSLNLSLSNLKGQIPREITRLSKLSTLDLSDNMDLLLHNPNLEDLAQNLTSLRELDLSNINISSTIPTALTNLSFLKSLSLSDTGLNGTFPSSIFHLPYLEHLDLSLNSYLTGRLPEFPFKVSLKELLLSYTRFLGKLPSSIENLQSLSILDLSYSNFEGPIPSSFGHLRRLINLYLSSCNFEGPIPSSFGHLRRLIDLDLSDNRLRGDVPSSFSNLTRLESLDLSGNNINIQAPSPRSSHWLSKLTKLTTLDISGLNYSGQFPPSIANLSKLELLNVNNNELVGPVPSWLMNLTQLQEVDLQNNNKMTANFDTFLKLKHLSRLQLDDFESILFNPHSDMNKSSPKFSTLSLKNCNLTEIPQFLKHQNKLGYLSLANNIIDKKIPQWLLKNSKESLYNLDLSSNLFTGFENPEQILQSNYLRYLDISYNKLQGSLPPISFPNLDYLWVSNNLLTGYIPESICKSSYLYTLDLSNNNFTGKIPPCIVRALTYSMTYLSLKGNNLHGYIPQSFNRTCQLQAIDLSQNQLEGKLPRLLVNCRQLILLDVGSNRINDTFPSWLGNLQELKVLILRYNHFYGTIGAPKSNSEFPSLQIISLSHNSHRGCLPTKYIQNWHAMKTINQGQAPNYMLSTSQIRDSSFGIIITNKGSNIPYLHISVDLKVVDFSSNNFRGEIPDTIGNLRGLQVLNFSNNDLSGSIPSSLVNITSIESLDLSHNKLSGEIPEELAQLNFLEAFNVSYNHLAGRIPQGNQFGTFENSSFVGNQLCGDPLTKRCGDEDIPTEDIPTSSSSTDGETDDDPVLMDWIIRVLGYGSGLIIGFVIGKITVTDMHCKWLVDTFGRRKKNRLRTRHRHVNL